jgi:TatD DNase family protein
MQLIDTHSHLDIHHFAHDYKNVLGRARNAGVIAQILPGVCQQWWGNLLNLCEKEPDLFAAIGLHPMYLNMHHPDHLDELEVHANTGNLVALGEIGLDYFIKKSNPKKQQDLFEAQLSIAENSSLPVLLHVRKAHDRVLATIRRKKFSLGGIVHAFSGSRQQAEHYIKLGFKISFGGNLTYDRATKIRGLAQTLPLDAIVLETDAPDIPPAAHHGERNLPEYLPQILDSLAELRDESKEELAVRTTENAIRVLNLEKLKHHLHE